MFATILFLSSLSKESADIINKTKDTIVELPAIIPIARGISRSVTRSNKKVYEEIESK